MTIQVVGPSVIATAQDLGADFTVTNPGGIDVSQYDGYVIQMNINRASGDSDGAAKLEISVDNVNWVDYPSSSQTIAASDTCVLWEVFQKYHKYVRLNFTNNAGSGSTAEVLGFYTSRIGT